MRRIRVCLFLDAEFAPLWACDLIRAIKSGGHSDIVLAVMMSPDSSGIATPASEPAHAGVRKWLERCQELLFERTRQVRDAFVPTSLEPVLDGVPRLAVRRCQRGTAPGLDPSEIDRIAAHEFDVGLRIGERFPCGALLQIPPCGIWSLRHGDERVSEDAPPGFWETMQGWLETGASLRILGHSPAHDRVLARARTSTAPWSVRDNASSIHWRALCLVPRKLAELHLLGREAFMARVDEANRDPVVHSGPPLGRPSNTELSRLIFAKTLRKARHVVANRFWRDQWIMLYKFSDELALSLSEYKRLVPPRDRMWADPQPIERDGRHYIFFEEMLFATNRGHISVVEIDREGRTSEVTRVLERPYHLSYPFLFEFEGTLYMIPESCENRTIELHRCVEFPHRWEFVHHIMEDIAACDATLVKRDGRWWLLAAVVDVEGSSSWDELFAFCADSPLSRTWTPHCGNPVISDCRNARPAGPVFEHRGAWYRPSQNNSGRYGRGFNLGRIESLNAETYREEIVALALPQWDDDVVATHTFSRAGQLHTIDAQIRARR